MSSPPRAGRPRDRDVDDRIVATTRALLREGGLAAVSIAAVAARAEVGRPTVYRRYRDAETLALAVLFADLQELVVDRMEVLIPPTGIVDQLVALVRPILAYYLENPTQSAAMLQLAMFSDSPGVAELEAQIMGFIGAVGALIEAAQARGEIDARLDPAVASLSFFALYYVTALGAIRGRYPTVPEAEAVFRAMIAQHLGVR
jgi:AcrR family transcriptional regulator